MEISQKVESKYSNHETLEVDFTDSFLDDEIVCKGFNDNKLKSNTKIDS